MIYCGRHDSGNLGGRDISGCDWDLSVTWRPSAVFGKVLFLELGGDYEDIYLDLYISCV